MSSRKEEERNEKIIRGLMKLPPNRRCINCNSLGPQYVCTNFWTFICTTCSGIHREFTHRVKSVSMAKFTSQEVEALQRGGNQRAREMFLKDWDLQRQRLPESSNVDRVRQFIKNVYVDKRYAGEKTSDKPPRDMQSLKNHEDDTRRASSYHSYSQSPPYEYQYEDRKYGRQVGVLTRKPGSDRGHYEGKISSFCSPGRLSEQMYEDRFANEGSGSRVSDYSVSSRGDPFRSDTQSPNFNQDIGLSSHPIHPRTGSLGSFGSFDSNSMSLRSVNSGSFAEVISEPEQYSGTQQGRMSSVPSLPRSSVSASAASLDPSSAPFVQQSATSSAPTVDLFADINHQHLATTSLGQKPSAVSYPENGGWATFDLPQHEASSLETINVPPVSMPPGDAVPLGNFDILYSINPNMQWPSVQNPPAHGPFSSVDNQLHGGPHEVQASTGPSSTKPWNAFEDSIGSLPQTSFENMLHKSEQVPAYRPPSTGDQYLSSKVSEDSSKDGFQIANLEDRPTVPSSPFQGVIAGSSFTPSVLPLMGGVPSHATDQKSTNPFDLPYESDLEPSSMFLGMSSLQAALPDPQLPPAFIGDITQPWFPQNSVTPYIPAVPQGGLTYMAGQAPSPQLPNIPSQGPVASLGGNPFA